MLRSVFISVALVLLPALGLASENGSFEAARSNVTALIDILQDRIYCAGEVSGEFSEAMANNRRTIEEFFREATPEALNAFLTARDEHGTTVLMRAVQAGIPELVDRLLDYEQVRASINELDHFGASAADMADADFAMAQGLINPMAMVNIMVLIPYMVTLPYYREACTSIKKRIIRAGGTPDKGRFKQWLINQHQRLGVDSAQSQATIAAFDQASASPSVLQPG